MSMINLFVRVGTSHFLSRAGERKRLQHDIALRPNYSLSTSIANMVEKKAIIVINSCFEDNWESHLVDGSPKVTSSAQHCAGTKVIEALGVIMVDPKNVTLVQDITKTEFADLFPPGQISESSSDILEEIVFIYIFSHGCPEGISMYEVNSFTPFGDIINLVSCAYSQRTRSEVVLIFGCCTSGSSVKSVLEAELWGIGRPINMSIICSTDVYLGSSFYLPKLGQSNFGIALCETISEFHKNIDPLNSRRKIEAFLEAALQASVGADRSKVRCSDARKKDTELQDNANGIVTIVNNVNNYVMSTAQLLHTIGTELTTICNNPVPLPALRSKCLNILQQVGGHNRILVVGLVRDLKAKLAGMLAAVEWLSSQQLPVDSVPIALLQGVEFNKSAYERLKVANQFVRAVVKRLPSKYATVAGSAGEITALQRGLPVLATIHNSKTQRRGFHQQRRFAFGLRR